MSTTTETTSPSSGEERRNTRCSKYNKDTDSEQDRDGGVPWISASAVRGAAPRRKAS